MKERSQRFRLIVALMSLSLLAGLWAFLRPDRWHLETGGTAAHPTFILTGEVTSFSNLPWLTRLWDAIIQVKWSLAGILAALILLPWLLRYFISPQNRRTYSILGRSLVASLFVHLLLAFVFSLWVVSKALYEAAKPQPLEMAVEADALAQERLALEIREQVTVLPPAPPQMVAEAAVIDRRPLPEIAMVQPPAQPAPIAQPAQVFAMESQKPAEAKTHERLPAMEHRLPPPQLTTTAPAAMEMRPPIAAEKAPEMKPLPSASPNAASPVAAAPLISAQPVPALPVSPGLKVRQQQPAMFESLPLKASEPLPRLAAAAPPVVKWGPQPLAPVQMESGRPQAIAAKSPEVKPLAPTASAVVKTEMAAQNAAPPPLPALTTTTPLPAARPALPPQLPRPAAVLAAAPPAALAITKMPALPPRPDIRMESPALVTKPYMLRDPAVRDRVIKELGGTEETEGAIKRSLDWISRNQEADGHWSITRFSGQGGHDVAATGLATLCYLGWGATHQKDGPHRERVTRAIKWLTGKMRPDGDLRGDGGNMYDHGIASIALAEAYGLTKDPALREPVEKLTAFIIRAQNQQTGGWRYRPGEAGDTSVMGWQVMALKSAELAGIPVPAKSLELTDRWLDSVAGGKHAGHYGYENRSPKPAMVAEAMFARQLLGTPRESPEMQESAEYLKSQMPEENRFSQYFWYYGSLALFQHQGPVWEEWNRRLRPILVSSQKRSGNDEGSWDPKGEWSNESGRLVTTAMATLSLEVYYRYLPLYGGAAAR